MLLWQMQIVGDGVTSLPRTMHVNTRRDMADGKSGTRHRPGRLRRVVTRARLRTRLNTPRRAFYR